MAASSVSVTMSSLTLTQDGLRQVGKGVIIIKNNTVKVTHFTVRDEI
jgi:hypothetical protein